MNAKNIIILLLLVSNIKIFSQVSDDIIGYWLTEDGRGQIQIYKKDNKYYGKIIWTLENKDKTDVNNPDPTLRNRKIIGLEILKDFKFNVEKKIWDGGTIYDPESGNTYSCYIWFENSDKNKLYLKGYILGMKMLGRKTIWTREKNKRV